VQSVHGAPLGGGGGGGGDPPSAVSGAYRSLLGEPVPALVTTLLVALLKIASRTVCGEALVLPWRYNAATPAACGAAIEVPLIVFVAVLLVYHADVMLEPGAKRSRQLP
jgi:hypothetical protein